MYEQNNASTFANDYGNFTSIQRVSDGHHSLSHSAEMADVGSALFITCSASSAALLLNAAQSQQTPLAQTSVLDFTENQQLAGFALTAVVTNETFDLSAPSNAIVHSNWLKRGASEDGFWV